MKNTIRLLIPCTIFLIASCGAKDPNKQIDEGIIKGNTYTSHEIGWTIEIPSGWAIIEKEQTRAGHERGVKAIEETIESEVDFSGLKNLIAFQKNRFNTFQSSSEPVELEYEGEWEENNATLKEIMYATYLNQGINTDSSATTIEKIDGLEFQKYSFTIYSPNGDGRLTQIIYGRLINNLHFSVVISYNNEKDKKAMMNAWRKSKFKKE